MLKALKRSEIQGTYLNIIKAMYSKPKFNIKLNGKKQCNSIKIRDKTRLPYLFNIELKVLARAIRHLKEIREMQVKKKSQSYLWMI